MAEARRGHGWWPYLAPYGLFLVLVEVERRLPSGEAGWADLLKVLVPGSLVLVYALRGDLPELAGFRWTRACFLDIGVGLGIAALWVAPYLLMASLPRGAPFDPDRLGAATIPVRLIGFAAVTPFVEELFVRSFLIRYAEVYDRPGDFRDLSIADYRPRGFWVTVVWFTLSHAPWQWIVAAPTGVILDLWLYRRRHLGATILAHAVANGTLWALVVFGPPVLRPFL